MNDIQVTLLGDCNQCGLCCCSRDGKARCENLIVDGELGKPGASRCGVYATRHHLMPIRMLNQDGTLAYESKCAVFEEHLAQGGMLMLPKECSYDLVKEFVQITKGDQ